jgi:hypothetical protein
VRHKDVRNRYTVWLLRSCPPEVTMCVAVVLVLLLCATVSAQSPGSVNSKCQLASLTDELQKEGIYG